MVHYRDSPSPGQKGNVLVAFHRETHWYDINQLGAGRLRHDRDRRPPHLPLPGRLRQDRPRRPGRPAAANPGQRPDHDHLRPGLGRPQPDGLPAAPGPDGLAPHRPPRGRGKGGRPWIDPLYEDAVLGEAEPLVEAACDLLLRRTFRTTSSQPSRKSSSATAVVVVAPSPAVAVGGVGQHVANGGYAAPRGEAVGPGDCGQVAPLEDAVVDAFVELAGQLLAVGPHPVDLL